jgi:hypothetical protein
MGSYQNHGGSNLKAGDYKLDKFVLYSTINNSTIDLNNIFRYIEIYEDIFSPYISAKLHLDDANNFPEKFPIVGQEKVEIVFKSDINSMKTVELVFRVYKLDTHKIMDNGKSQHYTLHLMSDGGYFNFTQYCGYSVNGPVCEMVKAVFTKHFPESVWRDRLEVENTAENYSFVIPRSYTPFKTIQWLSGKAYADKGKEYSPFLFYETLDGYKFKSISSIVTDGSNGNIPYYTYTQPNMYSDETLNETSGVQSILPNRYLKVQKFEELSRFDQVANIMNGIISSKLVSHDLVRKECRTTEFYEQDVFETMKKLGDKTHFKATDPETHRLMANGVSYYYLPSTPYTVNSVFNKIVDNHQTESLYLKRKYHMNTFLTQKIAIQVFGDSRRRVGDVIRLDVFKPQSNTTALTDKYDKNLSGEYLITSIKHTLGTAYSCKFELSRNCMGV